MNKKQEVINFIYSKIKNGKYIKGTRILSEPMLAQYLNISRTTVRLALEELSLKGIIEKRKGSGSYIKDSFNKKYIVISINKYALSKHTANFKNNLTELFKKNITNLGYIPYAVTENDFFSHLLNNESANKPNIKEIAGIIAIANHIDCKISEENNIPIVSVSEEQTPSFPSVNKGIFDFYVKINSLLKNHKFSNVHIFNYEDRAFSDITQLVLGYFKNNYKYHEIPISTDKNLIINSLEKYLKRIKNQPDAIVFLHNSLYINSQNLFKKYNNIFKHTKIITVSDKSEIFPADFKICRLEFNITEFAEKTMEILIKLINREQPINICHNVNCEIINEEILNE